MTRKTDQYNDVFERDDKTMLADKMEDRRSVAMVRAFMDRSAKYREPFLRLARQSREVYENWQPTSRSMIQRANLKLPFGFTVIETQLPMLTEVFFQDDEVLKFEGQDMQDAQWETLLTDFHKHQFQEMRLVPKTAQFIKSMLLDGTAFAKVPYKFKEIMMARRVTTTDPITGETFVDKEMVPEVTQDGPDLEVIQIYDFFPDWSIKAPGDIQNMRGCVHRTWHTLAALKEAGVYKNLKEVEHSCAQEGNNAWTVPYYEQQDFKRQFEKLNDSWREGIKTPGKIEVWEYWGLYDPKKNGKLEPWLLVVANGDVVIRSERNFYDYKFKPFICCPNYLRDSEFYGIPELSPLRSLVKEANTLRNARLDNVNLSVNPMWLVDRAAGINQRALYSRPNGILWTNDMNGVRPMQIPDPSIGSGQEYQELMREIQNASGLLNTTPAMGQAAKTLGRSATGAALVGQMATNRTGLKARLLSEYYFKPLAWIMLMTNRQFVTEDKWVRVSDPNAPNPFEILPADAFFRKFDFAVKTDLETGGQEGQMQKMQAVSQILQVAENSQPGVTNFAVLLEAMLRPLLGRQVKRFVRDEQEMSQMQAQQLAATQQVNAAQGQMAPQPNARVPEE